MGKKAVKVTLAVVQTAVEPTPERVRHANGDVRIGADRVKRIEDEPLKRLFNRNILDKNDPEKNRILFEAGERYYQHWYLGGLSPLAAINYGQSGRSEGVVMPLSAMPRSERIAHHRAQYRQAQSELGAYFLRALDPIVIEQRDPAEVGLRLTGQSDPNRGRVVAIDRLVESLDRLAKLWGMVS